MWGIVRIGAYILSSFTIWQFTQDAVYQNNLDLIHKHLALDAQNAMVFGVCSGISNYTGLDVSIIRMIWLLTCFYRGLGLLIYLLAFFIMPQM